MVSNVFKSYLQRLMAVCAGLAFLTSPAIAAPDLAKIGPDLEHPWGMDFISATQMLVTERGGRLLRVDLASGDATIIQNPPEVVARQQGGLLDVMVRGQDIYLCYSKMQDAGIVTAIDKATLEGDRLENRQTIFTSNNPSWQAVHYGCRLDNHAGYLYASLGERGVRENAQNPQIHDGSIIRLHLDRRIPADNPKREGWAAHSFSIGHRNPQGMAIHPDTKALWTHEHGPQGGDEINIIKSGGNYGWPLVSHGEEYGNGGKVSPFETKPGFVDPSWVWVPSIAPSGMAFYPARNGKVMFDELAGGLLVGSLKFRRLYVVSMGDDGLPVSERVLIDKALGRIRDVAVAPDGAIMLLNDANALTNPPGGLYRISQ